jgi:hypothetical protein
MLKKLFKYKDLGWKEIGEHFLRYTVLETRWFNIYINEMDAANWHPECHDHPWHFWTLILWNGYLEQTATYSKWRYPGSILYRYAKFAHNVTSKGKSYSIILTSKKVRKWGHLSCSD